jgi:hypothetical protein
VDARDKRGHDGDGRKISRGFAFWQDRIMHAVLFGS